jgi:hypothetical protein
MSKKKMTSGEAVKNHHQAGSRAKGKESNLDEKTASKFTENHSASKSKGTNISVTGQAKAKNFSLFNRYLKFKSSTTDVPSAPSTPILPQKRPHAYFHRNLYDLLSLNPSASMIDIKKSYRKFAAIHHPDKGGNALMFRCLNKTYEILSNKELRDIYDNNGMIGIKSLSEIDVSELEEYLKSDSGF